jgi:hypothetical protein
MGKAERDMEAEAVQDTGLVGRGMLTHLDHFHQQSGKKVDLRFMHGRLNDDAHVKVRRYRKAVVRMEAEIHMGEKGP